MKSAPRADATPAVLPIQAPPQVTSCRIINPLARSTQPARCNGYFRNA